MKFTRQIFLICVSFLLFLHQWNTDFVSSYAVFSENDSPYLQLAAGKSVLQLATRWDSHISPELFRKTILMARVSSKFCTPNYYPVFIFHMEAAFLLISPSKLFGNLVFRSVILRCNLLFGQICMLACISSPYTP